jgi:CXXX repeat modification system protein
MKNDHEDKKIIPLNAQTAGTGKQKKEVGRVTPEERDQIQRLFERRNGLVELSKTLAGLSREELDKSSLYDKVIADLGTVTVQFQSWWDAMKEKYQWESRPQGNWEINFQTCAIYLVY